LAFAGSDRQIEEAVGVLRLQRERLDLSYIEDWVKVLGLQEQWIATQTRSN
jgi:hypothetical protein